MAEYEEVPADLSRQLDEAERKMREIEREAGEAFAPDQCIWVNRCLYCRQGGRWRLIRCYA